MGICNLHGVNKTLNPCMVFCSSKLIPGEWDIADFVKCVIFQNDRGALISDLLGSH